MPKKQRTLLSLFRRASSASKPSGPRESAQVAVEPLEPRMMLSATPVDPADAPLAWEPFSENVYAETSLDQHALESLGQTARALWKQAGASAEQLAVLDSAEYRIVGLSGVSLGTAEGHVISIDIDAAGQGWFIDATPFDHSEFTLGADGTYTASADMGVDLLSIILHEQGHLLGLEDTYDPSQQNNLMYGLFGAGERRLAHSGLADGAVAGSLEGVHYASYALDIVDVYAHNERDNFEGKVNDMINGSGMNGLGINGARNFPSGQGLPSTWQVTSNSYQAEWQSQDLLDAGENPTNGKIGWTVFDLGSVKSSLDELHIWNIREASARRTATFNVYVAAAPTVALAHGPTTTTSIDYDFSSGGWTKINSSELTGTFQGYQVVDLDGINGRYVAIEILSNGGDAARVGLAEVAITSNAIAGVDFENAAGDQWESAPDDLDPLDGVTVSSGWSSAAIRSDGGANTAGGSTGAGDFPARLEIGQWSITIPDTVVLNLSHISFDARSATTSVRDRGIFGTSLDGGIDGSPLWDQSSLPARSNTLVDEWAYISVDLSDALYQGLTNTTVTFYWDGVNAMDIDSIVVFGTVLPKTLYWDADPNTAGIQGGSGTWNTTDKNWYDPNTGKNFAWTNGTSETAIFGDTAGTVTIAGGVTAQNVQFTTADYVITGDPLTLAGAATIQNAATATISASVAGTVGLVKDGSGTLNLTGAANSFTGAITINGGELLFGTGGASNLGIGGAFADDIFIADGALFAINHSGSMQLNGVICGGGAISKSGSGTLTLTAANTFTGDTAVNGGTLQVGTNNTTGSTLGATNYTGDIFIAAGSNLVFNNNASQNLSGVISGEGNLRKAGSGTLTLSGDNTFTGKTTVRGEGAGAPALSVSSFNSVNGGTPLLTGSSLGAPTTVANGTIDLGSGGNIRSAKLIYTGTGETTDRVLNVSFNSSSKHTLETNGSGLLTFTSALTINPSSGNASSSFTLAGSGDGEIAAGIASASPAIPGFFQKTGSGTWTIGGPFRVAGDATVVSGSLFLNDSFTTTNVASVMLVRNGATLGGDGTINTSTVTVEATGHLAPGAADGVAGTLTINGNLNISALAGGAGTLKFDLGADAASSDQIVTTGTLDIGAGTLGLDDFEFSFLSGLETRSYTLIDNVDASALIGSLGSNTVSIVGDTQFTLSIQNGDVVLTVLVLEAVDDDYTGTLTITEDQAVTIPASGVLANDTLLTGTQLVPLNTTTARGASIILNADGSFTYDPTVSTELQSLAEGQTVTDTFTYTLQGPGSVTDTATVTFTVTGVNDAPVITASEDGGVTEDATNPGGAETDSGTVNFSGVDLNDTHTASVTLASTTHSGGQLGSLTASVTTDTTGTGTGGEVTWNYSVDNSAIQFLAAGETLTEVYTVVVRDSYRYMLADPVTASASNVFDGRFEAADLYDGAPTLADVGTTNNRGDQYAARGGGPHVIVYDMGSTVEFNRIFYAQRPNALDKASQIEFWTSNVDPGAASLSLGILSNPPEYTLSGISTDQSLNEYLFDKSLTGRYVVMRLVGNDPSGNPGGYELMLGNSGLSTQEVTITITGTNDAPVAVANQYTTNEDTLVTGGNLLIDSSSVPVVYDFDSSAGDDGLSLDGWTDVRGVSGSINNVPFATQGGGRAVATTQRDNPHTSLIMRSPEFALGDNAEIRFFLAGGQGGTDIPSSESDVSETTTANGFQGMALRRVNTGDYVLTARRSGNGNAYLETVWNSATLKSITDQYPGETFTLDFIDAGDTSWGWTAVDDVSIRGLIDYDPDVDGNTPDDTLTVIAAQGASLQAGTVTVLSSQGASVTVNSDGTFTYDPSGPFDYLAVGETATDTFTYTISDGNLTSTASVTITITGVNDAPFAANNQYVTGEDTILTGGNVITDTSAPLVYDFDTTSDNGADLDGWTDVIGQSFPGNQVFGNGQAGGRGTGAQAYGTGNQDGAHPSLLMRSPVFSLAMGSQIQFSISGGSGSANLPTNESQITANSSGSGAQGMGLRRVSTGDYVLTARRSGSANSFQTITWDSAMLDAIVAAYPGESFTLDWFDYYSGGWGFAVVDDVSITIPIVVDSDPDASDTLTVAAAQGTALSGGSVTVTSELGAEVTVNSDGTFSYNPQSVQALQELATGEIKYDSFTYIVQDNHGAMSTASVTIAVTGANDPPVAIDDFYATDEDTALTGGNVISDGTRYVYDFDTTSDNGADLDGWTDVLGLSYPGDQVITNSAAYGGRGVSGLSIGVGNWDSAHPSLIMRSPSFELYQRAEIRFSIAGGTGASNLPANASDVPANSSNSGAQGMALRRESTGEYVLTARRSGNGNGYQQIVWDRNTLDAIAAAYPGETFTLDWVDYYHGGWGFAVVDDVSINTGNANDYDPDVNGIAPDDTVQVISAQGISLVAGTATVLSDSGATVTILSDGTFAYDPTTSATLQSLAAGETGTDTFSYTISDGGLTSTATVTITVTGINDAPTFPNGPASANLTETDLGLTTSGTLAVSDVDVTNVVTANIIDFSLSGTGTGSVPGTLTNAVLQSMLSITLSLPSGASTSDIAWTFDSGSEAFDFLAGGETLVLTYTVQATDNSGAANNSATETITVTITGTQDVADPPTVTAPPSVSTPEDTTVSFGFSAALVDTDGSETLTVAVSNVPVGMELSDGTNSVVSTGVPIDVTSWNWANLTLTPFANSDADFDLVITATATESDGNSAATSATVSILVNAVADAPTLSVPAAVTTAEDTAVNIPITGALIDTDGSESLSFSVSGAPSGAILSDGGANTVVSTGDPIDVTGWNLSNLTVTPPANSDSEFTLTVTATSTESAPTTTDPTVDTLTAQTVATISVTVNAVADAPIVGAVTSVTVDQNTEFAINGVVTLVDTDGSESITSVIIEGLPVGATIADGANSVVSTGAPIDITGWDFANLTVLPAVNSDEDFTLTITATSQETSPTSSDTTVDVLTAQTQATINVAVMPVADGVVINTTDMTGGEAEAIPLEFSFSLIDSDGSESVIAVSIGNIPDGAKVFVDGLERAVINGVADVTDAPDKVSISFDDNGVYELTVFVTTQEAASPMPTITNQATFTATINNRIPSATMFSVFGSDIVGFSNVTDPSAADVRSGFTFQFDLDGDGAFETTGTSLLGRASSLSGFVLGRLIDKDGGVSETIVLRGTGVFLAGLENTIAGANTDGFALPAPSVNPPIVPQELIPSFFASEGSRNANLDSPDLGASGGEVPADKDGWQVQLAGNGIEYRFGASAKSLPPLTAGMEYTVTLPGGTSIAFTYNDGVPDLIDRDEQLDQLPGLEEALKRLLPDEFGTLKDAEVLPEADENSELTDAFWSDWNAQTAMAAAGFALLANVRGRHRKDELSAEK